MMEFFERKIFRMPAKNTSEYDDYIALMKRTRKKYGIVDEASQQASQAEESDKNSD